MTGEYQELLQHVGHTIECVTYGGDGEVWNVAVECTVCNTIICDADNPKGGGTDAVHNPDSL